ncbi:MAG TPA: hypothetical protein VFG86_13940 [Chloroflexota bacterium]|nr:hypothetical protein [Chloroflexota bacterium]
MLALGLLLPVVLALPELPLGLLEPVEPASFEDDGEEVGEVDVELAPKELVDGLEPKELVLVDGLLKPP